MNIQTNDRGREPLPAEETAAFDPFYAEFKLAADLPVWLKLQHDIRADVEKLMTEGLRARTFPADLAACLRAINERIAAYNRHVPNVHLRKPELTPDNWAEQCEEWL